ncbi:phage portal protein [Flavobacterium sp.]|jgi:lambda family phage portal protein|uniref:phage portal protein n=1 Tax=Flavobacterium sp. TaxID=239 RepID=UPI0037BE9FDD
MGNPNPIKIITPYDKLNFFQKINYKLRETFKPQIITPETPVNIFNWMGSSFGNSIGWGGSKSRGALNENLSRYQVVYKDYRELRKQARKSWVESTETRAIVGRSVELTVSSGIKLDWTPVFSMLGYDMESQDSKKSAKKLLNEVHQKWVLSAESCEFDVTERKNLYQLQYFLRLMYRIDGEYFCILRYYDDPKKMSPVGIQIVRPEQIMNPSKAEDIRLIQERENICVDGIELDKYGKAVAYYVYDAMNYVRIPKKDPISGRIFMIHSANIEEVGQVRGISTIASHLHELSKLTGFKLAELQAALVNAVMAVWIEPSETNNASKVFSASVKKRSDEAQTDVPGAITTPSADFDKAGIIVQNLKAGEKIHSFQANRPNVNFEKFYDAILKSLCASEGMSQSVVFAKFGSNYSAHRGELLLTWNKIEIEREQINNDFNNPVFQMWFWESVKSGIIQIKNYSTSFQRAAWVKCDWIGMPKIDMDPVRTVQAASMKVKEGFSHRARETEQINGSEFYENVNRLSDENPKLYEANKYLVEVSQKGNLTMPENPEKEDDSEKSDSPNEDSDNLENEFENT